MDRPATRNSLWVATSDLPEYSPLQGDTTTDVLVVGGGMTGLQTAYLLKQAGLNVVLIDRHRLARGVSGHTTAKITALHGLTYRRLADRFGAEAAQAYAAANLAALEDISDLVLREGIACEFKREPACTYAATGEERSQIEDEVEAAREAGLPAVLREDLSLPYPTGGGVWLDDQACFHPVRYLGELARLVHGQGSSVHEMTTALELDEDAARVTTDRGVVQAQHVVVATHFPVFDKGPLSTRIMARRSYVIAAPLPEPLPGMFISTDDDYRSTRAQSIDGLQWTLFGGEPHRTGEGGDERERYLRLQSWADERFKLRPDSFEWSTQDIWTVDELPFIGRYRKENARIHVATGFRGWGMTHSMVAARILSDAILRRDNDWARLYDPWDRSVAKGAGAFVKQVAESVKGLAEGKLTGEPACTHMGCGLHWNDAERSWDCPCHGSRFNEAGDVLHGPAIAALEAPPEGGG